MTSSPEGEGRSKQKDDKWWHYDGGGGQVKDDKDLMLIFESSFSNPHLNYVWLHQKMEKWLEISFVASYAHMGGG